MFKRGTMMATFAVLPLFAAQAQAEEKEKESSAEIEIGAAGEWGVPGGSSSFGPSAAIEFTLIKNWLEIEAGVSPLFRRGQTQWGT